MDERAKDYFVRMGDGISLDLRAQWEEEIAATEAEHMNNPAAMDILTASAKPSEQVHAPTSENDTTGAEDWIQMAIDYEKMQYVEFLMCRSGN
jgi:hypothetical protein